MHNVIEIDPRLCVEDNRAGTSGRSRVLEDDTRDLFTRLYEQCVFQEPGIRRRAIKMLAAAYGVE